MIRLSAVLYSLLYLLEFLLTRDSPLDPILLLNIYRVYKLSRVTISTGYNLTLPPWICQPYVREAPEEHVKRMQAIRKRSLEIENNEVVRSK